MLSKLPSEKTTALALATVLRRSLSEGRWPPGAALRQADLAAEYGVSRIPVREALTLLQAEGLVVIEPNRGAFVASHTAAELEEIFDLRILLEGETLRLALPRHNPASLRKLDAIQRELDFATEPSEWLRLDREFHEALYAPSARPRNLALIAGLRRSVERFYAAKLSPESRREGWNDERQQLIEAVRRNDAKAAITLLHQHLHETRRTALASLAEISR